MVGAAGRERRHQGEGHGKGAAKPHEIAWTRSMFVAPAVWLCPPSITMVSPACTIPSCFKSASPLRIISSVVFAKADFTGTTPHQRLSRRNVSSL